MIYNPLEQFEIVKFIAMEGPLFGYLQFGLTNIGFYLILASLLLIFLHLQYNREGVLGLGNTLMLCLESFFGFVLQLVKSQIGPKGQPYFPAIYSLFLFILFLNLLGLIPYSFTATAQFALTLGFSATIVLGVTLLGLHRHGLHFFSFFVPAGTPLPLVPLLVLIETVSYLARAFSLGIRLSANMLAGHILLHLISSFSWKFITGSLIGLLLAPVPLLLLTLLYGLEVAIAFIQAYVFCLLTCSYVKDALDLHSENSPLENIGIREGFESKRLHQSLVNLSSKRGYSTLSNSSNNSTAVVLWGSNLSSTLGLRFTEKLRGMVVSLPPFEYSVIVGLLLSDGWLQKGKYSKNARLGFKQSTLHAGFALWIYSLLSHYCQSLPFLTKSTLSGQLFFGISVQTRTYPCLTVLHSAWYLNGIKVIPVSIFEDLTPVALAIWAQGDGTKRNRGFTFNTQGFTLQQAVLLLNVLHIKFGLNCTIYFDRRKPLVHVRSNSMRAFRAIVYPYFHPSMLYKLK